MPPFINADVVDHNAHVQQHPVQHVRSLHDDTEWLTRIQIDVKEHIRQLSNPEKREQALKTLKTFPFDDLIDPISTTQEILSALHNSNEVLDLLRKSIYAVVRKYIRTVRTPEITKLSDELEASAAQRDTKDRFVAELDLCVALLGLIPDDQDMLEQVVAVLHPETTKRSAIKMIRLVTNMGIHWRRKWFPIIIRIEECFDKIMRKQEGLMELKEYIYNNYDADWRVLQIAFECMQRIIFDNVSEDVRNSAYWEKMTKKNRIKIANFADPTPILNMLGRCSPFLTTPSREAAVRFLIAMTKHPDEEIANDARSHILKYSAIEKETSILALYQNFLNPQSSTPMNRAEPEIVDTPEELFPKVIGCLGHSKLPIEIIEQLIPPTLPDQDPNTYFTVEDNLGVRKDRFYKDSFETLSESEKLAVRKKAILQLTSLFQFQPRRPRTWNSTRLLINHISYQLDFFPQDNTPYVFKETLQKLKEFYEVTKGSEEKLDHYIQQLAALETRAQEEKMSTWRAITPPSLSSDEYDEQFIRWKNDHNLDSITIENFEFQKRGYLEFTFKVTPVEGSDIRVKAFQDEKGINISVLENQSDPLTELIQKYQLPSYKNTYIKLDERLKKVIKKGYVEKADSILVVDYFEELLCSRSPTMESISLSAAAFISLFGFTLNGNTWGLPTLEELQEILDLKLRLSYLSHSYGSEHCEAEYVAYCNQQIASGKLALIPQMPFLPKESKDTNLVADFYNLIISNNEAYYHPIIHTYSKILSSLKEYPKSNRLLYETSLAFQRILPKYENIMVFSVNRTSIFLKTIIDRLSKTKICDLQSLITCILSKTAQTIGNNKYRYSLSLIESFNKMMRILFPTNQLSEAEKKVIYTIYTMMTSLYKEVQTSYLLQSKNVIKRAQASYLKILCEFYILSHYYGNTWSSIQSHIVNFLNAAYTDHTVNRLDIIKILMRSIIKFYILNKTHSNSLIHTLRGFLYETVGANHLNKHFLLEMTEAICSHSLIIWHTGLQKSLLNIFIRLISLYETSYDGKDAVNLFEILNTTTLIKQYLNPSQIPQNTKAFYDRVHSLWNRAQRDTITHHIVPAWKSALVDGTSFPLRSILRTLSVKVKEDGAFLEALEAAYQTLIFANKTNPHSLKDIYKEIARRFRHVPIHKRIRGRLMSTYKPDGSLFEEKYAYDILGVLLGVEDSGLSYLRLEDNRQYFLSALICPVKANGKTYITGFGGGGKMKMKVNRHGVPDNALLPQIQVNEITEGKFGKLLESVSFKEAYYYWQRMFNPTSLDGDIIFGAFKVMYVDPGSATFGSIMPHDGFGVISERVMGQFKLHLEHREPYSVRTPIQTYQAVQHNKRSTDPALFDASVEEFAQQSTQCIEEYLSANQSDQSSVKDLYSRLITGGIVNGRNFVAIPATGENHIILPLPVKQHDVWLGKTPYEKTSNVLLKHEDQISHLRSDDPQQRDEAIELSKLTGFQYSFTASNGEGLIFNKGILVIIPEDKWTFPGVDIVFCTKDNKVDSRWETKKSQPIHGHQEHLMGVLTPTQKYGPGSFIAISPDIQIDRWNADYDGDIVTFEAKSKQTQQYELMSKSSNSTGYSVPKIPKTFTPPTMKDGSFNGFRFSSIVQSRTANLLTQYARIYDVYIALKPEYQSIVASTVVNMMAIGKIIRCILVDEQEETLQHLIKSSPGLIILKILSAGVKTGSDSFKSKVDWTFFREFGDIMFEVYQSLEIPTDLVYFKRLCIDMHREAINFNKLMIDTKFQSKYFDSLPIHILYRTLAATPEYKMKRLSQLLLKQIETDEISREIFALEAQMRKQRQQRRGKRYSSSKHEGHGHHKGQTTPSTSKSKRSSDAHKPSQTLKPDETLKKPEPINESPPTKTAAAPNGDIWIKNLFSKILEQARTFMKHPPSIDDPSTYNEELSAPYHDDFYVLERNDGKDTLRESGIQGDYSHFTHMNDDSYSISIQDLSQYEPPRDDIIDSSPEYQESTEEKTSNSNAPTLIDNISPIMDTALDTHHTQQQLPNTFFVVEPGIQNPFVTQEESLKEADARLEALTNTSPVMDPPKEYPEYSQGSINTDYYYEYTLKSSQPIANSNVEVAPPKTTVQVEFKVPSIDTILKTAAQQKRVMRSILKPENTTQPPLPQNTPVVKATPNQNSPSPQHNDLDLLAYQVHELTTDIIVKKRVLGKDWLRTLLKK